MQIATRSAVLHWVTGVEGMSSRCVWRCEDVFGGDVLAPCVSLSVQCGCHRVIASVVLAGQLIQQVG